MADLSLDAIGQLFAGQNQQRGLVQSMRPAPAPLVSPFLSDAIKTMNLTPQEQYLYQHHLQNLSGSGKVVQPNGDISTLLQAVVTGPDGKFYNIPTVWDGKVLPPDQAAKQAAQAGWDKWPAYDTSDAADERYEKMHDYLEQDTGAWIKSNPNYRSGRGR